MFLWVLFHPWECGRWDTRWERLDDWNRRSRRNACPLAAVDEQCEFQKANCHTPSPDFVPQRKSALFLIFATVFSLNITYRWCTHIRPYYFASHTLIVILHAILTFLCATTRSIRRTFSNDGERSAFAFIFKIGHALNRSLLYRRYISGGFYFEVEKRMEMVAQIKFFSLTATQILSAGPTFKNAIAVTENRKLRAFRRCIDRSILLLMGVPRPEGRRVVLRFENQRNRRRAKD